MPDLCTCGGFHGCMIHDDQPGDGVRQKSEDWLGREELARASSYTEQYGHPVWSIEAEEEADV